MVMAVVVASVAAMVMAVVVASVAAAATVMAVVAVTVTVVAAFVATVILQLATVDPNKAPSPPQSHWHLCTKRSDRSLTRHPPGHGHRCM